MAPQAGAACAPCPARPVTAPGRPAWPCQSPGQPPYCPSPRWRTAGGAQVAAGCGCSRGGIDQQWGGVVGCGGQQDDGRQCGSLKKHARLPPRGKQAAPAHSRKCPRTNYLCELGGVVALQERPGRLLLALFLFLLLLRGIPGAAQGGGNRGVDEGVGGAAGEGWYATKMPAASAQAGVKQSMTRNLEGSAPTFRPSWAWAALVGLGSSGQQHAPSAPACRPLPPPVPRAPAGGAAWHTCGARCCVYDLSCPPRGRP